MTALLVFLALDIALLGAAAILLLVVIIRGRSLQYLALLEWPGRAIRPDTPGHITAPPPQLITRCGLDPDRWLDGVQGFGELGGYVVGHPSLLRRRASQIGRRWLKGQGGSVVAYSKAA